MEKNELTEVKFEKGKLLDTVMMYKERKKYKEFIERLEQLVDFKEELEENISAMNYTLKYTEKLIERFNNAKVSREEAEDNFVKYIKGYRIQDWEKIVRKLENDKPKK